MPIKNIIFDWNGTLVDDFKPVVNVVNNVLKHHSKEEVSAEFLRENYEADPMDFYKMFNIKMSRETMLNLLSKFMSEETLPLVDDSVKQTVNELNSKNINLFIISSCPKDTLLNEIKRSGLSEIFPSEKILGGSKDKPALINSLNLNPEETAIVGDTHVDIEAGKQSKIKTIAYLKGYQSEEKLKEHNPDYTINHLKELLKLL
ncbi:HAD family hydrolase [Candidatus Woesearchaeota archaeon]|nr:HAD family hydrolase [Candidatus Woesearchaeota archaeon]